MGTALTRLCKKGKWLGSNKSVAASLTLGQFEAALQVFTEKRGSTLWGITKTNWTYFMASYTGCRNLQHSTRWRGIKAHTARLSNELLCVLEAWDRAGQTVRR